MNGTRFRPHTYLAVALAGDPVAHLRHLDLQGGGCCYGGVRGTSREVAQEGLVGGGGDEALIQLALGLVGHEKEHNTANEHNTSHREAAGR